MKNYPVFMFAFIVPLLLLLSWKKPNTPRLPPEKEPVINAFSGGEEGILVD